MKKINLFTDLTKKERAAYSSTVDTRNNKYRNDIVFINYLFENNSIEDIKTWFKTSVATHTFKGAYAISFYAFNRINNRLENVSC